MAKFVNLTSPIPQDKQRTITVDNNGIKVFMVNWYLKHETNSSGLALFWARGYQVAYEAMGISLKIVVANELLLIASRVSWGQEIPEDRRRTYSIMRNVEKNSWFVTISLETASITESTSSIEEAKAFRDGFCTAYAETGVLIRNFHPAPCEKGFTPKSALAAAKHFENTIKAATLPEELYCRLKK